MMQIVSASALDNVQQIAADRVAVALLAPVTDVDPGNPGLLMIEKKPSNDIAGAIDALTIERLPNFRLEGPVALVTQWLATLLATPGLTFAQSWIVADVAVQARRFADSTGATHVALKLEIIRDNACRKLHHDYVAYRQVCTYRGPGTQWLPRHHEAALGDERVAVPDEWLRSVPRFAAALFTGRLLAGANPILHRSPPIAGTGAIRLVLTINEPFSGRH